MHDSSESNKHIRLELLNGTCDLFENMAQQDEQYRMIEEKKQEILEELDVKLDEKEIQLVYDLVDCMESRIGLLAKSFFFVRTLDLICEEKKQGSSDMQVLP